MKLAKAPADPEIIEPLRAQLGEPIELSYFDYSDLVQCQDGLFREAKETVTAKEGCPIYWFPAGRAVAYKSIVVRSEKPAPRVWVIPQERVTGMLIKPVEMVEVERPRPGPGVDRP